MVVEAWRVHTLRCDGHKFVGVNVNQMSLSPYTPVLREMMFMFQESDEIHLEAVTRAILRHTK